MRAEGVDEGEHLALGGRELDHALEELGLLARVVRLAYAHPGDRVSAAMLDAVLLGRMPSDVAN